MSTIREQITRAPANRLIAPMMGNMGLHLIGASQQDAIHNPSLQIAAAEAVIQRWKPDIYFPVMNITAEAKAVAQLCEMRFTASDTMLYNDNPAAIDICSEPTIMRSYEAMVNIRHRFAGRCVTAAYLTAPFTLTALLADSQQFYKALVTRPDSVVPFLKGITMMLLKLVDYLLHRGIMLFCLLDPTASLLPGNAFMSLAGTYLASIIEYLHQQNASCIVHICGNTSPHLNSLINLNADVLSLDTSAMGVNWSAAVQQKASCILMGGPDPVQTLQQGTSSEIEAQTTTILEYTKQLPDFILSTACDVPLHTSPAKIDALIEYAEKWRTDRASQT